MNTIIAQMWPFVARMATAWAEENIDVLLEQNKPTWLRSVTLHRFSVGEACPEVSGIKVGEGRGAAAQRSCVPQSSFCCFLMLLLQVYDSAESAADEVLIEVDFVWAGQQHISFVAKPVPKTKARARAGSGDGGWGRAARAQKPHSPGCRLPSPSLRWPTSYWISLGILSSSKPRSSTSRCTGACASSCDPSSTPPRSWGRCKCGGGG